jgi:hypothetical protein
MHQSKNAEYIEPSGFKIRDNPYLNAGTSNFIKLIIALSYYLNIYC